MSQEEKKEPESSQEKKPTLEEVTVRCKNGVDEKCSSNRAYVLRKGLVQGGLGTHHHVMYQCVSCKRTWGVVY